MLENALWCTAGPREKFDSQHHHLCYSLVTGNPYKYELPQAVQRKEALITSVQCEGGGVGPRLRAIWKLRRHGESRVSAREMLGLVGRDLVLQLLLPLRQSCHVLSLQCAQRTAKPRSRRITRDFWTTSRDAIW